LQPFICGAFRQDSFYPYLTFLPSFLISHSLISFLP
jgi:hypothetical protein